MNTTADLTSDTEAILLLCGHFDSTADETKPLSTAEYNKLVRWLDDEGLRPSSIVDVFPDVNQFERTGLEPARIERLLSRGAALAVAVEKWQSHSLWVISRADSNYPKRYLNHLKSKAPPILYGTGDPSLLQGGGLAVVGSRDVNEEGIRFSEAVAAQAAAENITIISGGARGVDQTAMIAALEGGGAAVGVLANNLNRAAVNAQYRGAIVDQRLVLVSPYIPTAGFNVGQAMGRNKLIYTLADWALVVDSRAGSGGTWTGATENLRKSWTPLFVRGGKDIPEGNKRLLQEGGIDLNRYLLNGASLKDTLHQLAAQQLRKPAHDPIELPTDDDDFSGESIFHTVWPRIERRLATPCTLKQLKEELGPLITPKQVEVWLRHAEELAILERKGRPAQYYLKRSTTDDKLESTVLQYPLDL